MKKEKEIKQVILEVVSDFFSIAPRYRTKKMLKQVLENEITKILWT